MGFKSIDVNHDSEAIKTKIQFVINLVRKIRFKLKGLNKHPETVLIKIMRRLFKTSLTDKRVQLL